jgi:hypothetical protein
MHRMQNMMYFWFRYVPIFFFEIGLSDFFSPKNSIGLSIAIPASLAATRVLHLTRLKLPIRPGRWGISVLFAEITISPDAFEPLLLQSYVKILGPEYRTNQKKSCTS